MTRHPPRRARSLIALITLLSFTVATGGFAQTPESERAAAREGIDAYNAGNYELALKRLQEVETHLDLLEASEQVSVHRFLAYTQVAFDRDEEAKAEFRHALQLDPTLTLPDTVSPKIRAVFDSAKADVAAWKIGGAPAVPAGPIAQSYADGLRDGTAEANKVSMAGWGAGGGCGGFLCGPVGCLGTTGVSYLLQPTLPQFTDHTRSNDYITGYQAGYHHRVKVRRGTAALVGGTIGTLLGIAAYVVYVNAHPTPTAT